MDPFLAKARHLDETDELREYRSVFFHGEEELVYFDGNSLGRLAVENIARINDLVGQEWGGRLIRSWNDSWYGLSLNLGNKVAGLLGAEQGSTLFSESTSTNLYKLAWSALRHQKGRSKIISDTLNFPTDLYILQGIAKEMNAGHNIQLVGSRDGIYPDLDEMENLIDENTALLTLSLVTFKSGYLYDMEKINRLAHDHGALVLWDLSHAAGAVEIDLASTSADLAVGCSYKYLNGGPGSPAFLYVKPDLIRKLENPIQGWFGHHDPFAFDLGYSGADDIRRFAVGSPPILSLAAVEAGLDTILEAGMPEIRRKSIALSGFLMEMAAGKLDKYGVELASPQDPHRRGSHVSLRHPEAWRICQALIHPPKNRKPIMPDFRAPDNVRVGLCPLYNTFGEVLYFIQSLEEVLLNKEYLAFSAERPDVT